MQTTIGLWHTADSHNDHCRRVEALVDGIRSHDGCNGGGHNDIGHLGERHIVGGLSIDEPNDVA